MKLRFGLYGTVSLFACAVPALAQEAPANEADVEVSEIIVSARRREESLQEVPLTVQAVTGQDLQKLEIRQFEDVTKLVAGLTLAKSGSATSASIRGVNFDARASGSATSVEFYRNDAVISAGALFQAVYDISQIEVLRGPQGTLRGRASPSGSITVTTRKPDLGEVGAYFSGTIAQRDKWNLNGALNVPVIADILGVRVAGYTGESRGNNVRGFNVPTGQIDKDISDDVNAIRGSVRADPLAGDLVFDFSYEAIHQKSRNYDQSQSFQDYRSTAAASPVTISPEDRLGVRALAADDERRIKLFNWQVTGRQFGQVLTYVGSRTQIRQTFIDPFDDAGLFGTTTSVIPPTPATSPISVIGQLTQGRVNQTTHEVRLQNDSRIFGLFDYIVGAFRVKADTPTQLTVPQGLSATVSGTTPNYTLNSFSYRGTYRFRSDEENSLFGNLTLHLGDRTEIAGGLRRIWFKADSGVRSGVPGTDPATWANNASVRRCFGNPEVPGCLPTKKATIYSLSAKHNFNDDIMAYASFGTSWRPGNSLIGYRGTTVGSFLNQFLNLEDEKSKSYELGLKTSWLDRRARFNISVFHQKFDNYPFFSTTLVPSIDTATNALVPGFNFVAPVAVKITGLEADFGFDVSPRFTMGGTVAYANGKIKNGLFPCVDLNDDNVQDVTPPTPAQLQAEVGANQIDTCVANASSSSQPRWSGTLQAEYTLPVGGVGDAFLRGFTSWRGNSDGDTINPNDQVKAYALVDLFAGLREPDQAWEISLYAKNLLSTRRVLTRSAAPLSTPITPAGATATYNYLAITTTEPREFGLNLRISLGSR